MPGMQSALPEVPTPTIWLQQTQITIPGDLITAKTLGEQRSRSSVSRDGSCRADQLTEEGVRIKMSLLLSNRSVLTILSRVACRLFKQASLFKQQTTLQAPLGWILNGSAWQQHGQRSLTFTTTSPNLLLRLKFMVFFKLPVWRKALEPDSRNTFYMM